MIALDLDGKKEGRGAYLCYDISCADKATKSRSLERHLKAARPDDLIVTLKRHLYGENPKALRILGFAHRARSLIFGATATLTAMQNGKARAVILALDLSTNSSVSMRETARLKDIPVYEFGCKEEFGAFFKRRDVGVIGLTATSFADGIREILNEG